MKLFSDYLTVKPEKNLKLTEKLKIRPAVSGDIPCLASIKHDRGGGDYEAHVKSFQEDILTANDKKLLILAQVDEKIAGFARAGYFSPPPNSPVSIAPEGWYLLGIIVSPEFRFCGVGSELTVFRLDFIAKYADEAYYFCNAKNLVSIDLHKKFGFVEITRDFTFPGVTFTGGVGILFRVSLPSGNSSTFDVC
ncbi:MAG: GNAT family N-acetyltransferase [Candidatus Eremiobacterota bacterium]